MAVPSISTRARHTPPSPIRKLSSLATKSAQAGNKIYHLNIGQPDIKTPVEFFEGVRLYNQSVLAYEQSQGNSILCNEWSAFMNRSLGLKTEPSQFQICTGASEALIFLFMVCCDPGDEVIIFDPTYANYIGFAAIAGVKLVPIHTSLDENFRLPAAEEIEKAVNLRTKAILLCSPNNPTGTVYSRSELTTVLDICNRHDLFFVIDETYREFVYDREQPLSILHLEPNNPNVIVVDSLSKRFSLCGARIGSLITTNQQILAATLSLAQARLSSPTIEQYACAHMLSKISLNFIDAVRDEYEKRRNTLLGCLKKIDGVVAHQPRGAFYTVVQLPVKNAEDFASYLLREFSYQQATTFVAPAAGFYMESQKGMDKVRIAYVLNSEAIESAVDILGRGLSAYLRK